MASSAWEIQGRAPFSGALGGGVLFHGSKTERKAKGGNKRKWYGHGRTNGTDKVCGTLLVLVRLAVELAALLDVIVDVVRSAVVRAK